jgi:hypothetical protein
MKGPPLELCPPPFSPCCLKWHFFFLVGFGLVRQKGEPDGAGMLIHCNNGRRASTIEGSFLNSVPHGECVFTWPTGGRKVLQLYQGGKVVAEAPLSEEQEASLIIRDRVAEWEADRARTAQQLETEVSRKRAEFEAMMAAEKAAWSAQHQAQRQQLATDMQEQRAALVKEMMNARTSLEQETGSVRAVLAQERLQVQIDIDKNVAEAELALTAAADRLAAERGSFEAEKLHMTQYKEQIGSSVGLNVGG